MKFVLLYCLFLFSISKAENSTIELEEIISKTIIIESNPGLNIFQEKITKILNTFQVKSELKIKNALLQIRKIEEAAKRQREDSQRDILEEEKIIIEETHFTDVEFLVKHCSSKQNEATNILLQSALGGIRTCVGVATKKTDLQQVLFEDLYKKLSLTEDELNKLQENCNMYNNKEIQNCFFEKLYLSNGPIINLYLRKNEAENGLKDSEKSLEEMKNNLEECSEVMQQNMNEDKNKIVDNFKICCGNVVSRTKTLLKLGPNRK